MLLIIHNVKGQQLHDLEPYELIERQYISQEHAEKVATIQVQDFQGRIKPISTLSLDLLRKIHGRSNFKYIDKGNKKKQLSPVQVFLGMQYKSDSWQLLEFIKIEKKAIKTLQEYIEINSDGYANAAQFFDFNGNYKLKKIVAKAFAKSPGKRTVLDKDIIKIDERINIVWGIFNGQFLKVFPKINDSSLKWYAPSDIDVDFNTDDQIFLKKIIPTYFKHLDLAITTGNWENADETIELISNFQQKKGTQIIIPKTKINLEIWFNNHPIFLWLSLIHI